MTRCVHADRAMRPAEYFSSSATVVTPVSSVDMSRPNQVGPPPVRGTRPAASIRRTLPAPAGLQGQANIAGRCTAEGAVEHRLVGAVEVDGSEARRVATATTAMMSMAKELPRRHRSPDARRASRALRSDMPPFDTLGQTLRHEGRCVIVRARSDREATHFVVHLRLALTQTASDRLLAHVQTHIDAGRSGCTSTRAAHAGTAIRSAAGRDRSSSPIRRSRGIHSPNPGLLSKLMGSLTAEGHEDLRSPRSRPGAKILWIPKGRLHRSAMEWANSRSRSASGEPRTFSAEKRPEDLPG